MYNKTIEKTKIKNEAGNGPSLKKEKGRDRKRTKEKERERRRKKEKEGVSSKKVFLSFFAKWLQIVFA